MTNPDLTLVRAFESQLDAALLCLPVVTDGGEGAISLALSVIEACNFEKQYGAADHLKRGFNVLLPYMVRNRNSTQPEVSDLLQALDFAGHYYILRDYLYYTYNAPGSLDWRFSDTEVNIAFVDHSIPRQYFLQANNWFLTSLERFADSTAKDVILSRLQAEQPVKGSPIDDLCLKAIEAEIDTKLGSYFNFLSGEPVDLGGYLFTEFELVFRALLIHALFHRYYGTILNLAGPVNFRRHEIVDNLALATELERGTCERIMNDIVYSKRAQKARIQPMHFALYDLEEASSVAMAPHTFSTWEGYVEILRITAIRNPELYLRNVSGVLARKFTSSVAAMFTAQGFHCLTEVKLDKFDPALPDIDLLVISEEATLGYVLLICELKSPIPTQWSKDQLRALNEDSISKGFSQLDRISAFFSSAQGVEFIASRLPKTKLAHFEEGFLVACKDLVITSQNAGMFFSDVSHTILDYQTLDRILRKCDGDIAFVLNVFKDFNSWLDAGHSTETQRVEVENRMIKYEVSGVAKLVDFTKNVYKSEGIHEQMLKDFLEAGGIPSMS